jgi:L-ascorbate metabolism protein UlaG (beta-lactamase superfamily)
MRPAGIPWGYGIQAGTRGVVMAKGSTGIKVAGLALGAAATAAAVWVVKGIPAQIGGDPTAGARGERVRRSPQFRDGKFHNPVPSTVGKPGVRMLRDFLNNTEVRKPKLPIPLVRTVADPLPRGTQGLQITWYGHASALVEIEDCRVLIDPVWSDRVSPSQLVGPARLHEPPVPLDAIGPVDAVIISHDHYDHLDMATILALAQDEMTTFLVPLGVGAHLERWGLPSDRVVELDWDESSTVAGIRFTVTPARHFSGRGLRRDNTLWGSWVLAGATRKLFYSGDTGYFDGFARIGEEHGPFDATLVQVGAYGESWPDIHMVPEDGLSTHLDVRGGVLIPVHWCTYVLAFHSWSEPIDRLWRDAKERGVTLAVPRPGERVDVDNPPEVVPWWQPLS